MHCVATEIMHKETRARTRDEVSLDFHQVTWSWRRTLTNRNHIKHVFPLSTEMTSDFPGVACRLDCYSPIYSFFVRRQVGEKYVFFYDGTVTCFEGRHRALASFALVVMVMFIIVPLIIIVLLTKGIWKVDPQYANALTNGLRPRCSWWWAFDLSRRIILVAVSVFITDYVKRQVSNNSHPCPTL